MERLGCLKLMAAVFGQEVIEHITQSWLDGLTPREQGVIKLRFGLKDEDKSHTLQETGEVFQVTGERVRQVENKALRHIRLNISLHKFFYKVFSEGMK